MGHGKDLFLLREFFRAGHKINISYHDIKAVYRGTRGRKDRVIALFLAAGEEKSNLGKIPKFLLPPKEINLKHFCRDVLKNHLLKIDRHENLFVRVPRLGLPKSLQLFLLYNQTLNNDDEKYDDDNNIVKYLDNNNIFSDMNRLSL